MKSALYRLAASESMLAPLRQRVASGGVSVFMYHDVGADVDHEDAWQVVRRAHFRAQVEYLKATYELVDLDAAARMMSGAQALPARPAAVLTFDDGLRGNHTHLLPIVRDMQVPVTIYVATSHIESQSGYWFDRIVNALQRGFLGVVDLSHWRLGSYPIEGPYGAARWASVQRILASVKLQSVDVCEAVAAHVERQVRAAAPADSPGTLEPLTVEMLAELAAEPLVTLGSHTHGHEVLPQVDACIARASIDGARERIERWTGSRVRHFAYPAGRNCEQTRALVAELGYVTAMGTQPGIWFPGADVFRIPRISVGRYDSLATFKVNAVGGIGRLLRRSDGKFGMEGEN